MILTSTLRVLHLERETEHTLRQTYISDDFVWITHDIWQLYLILFGVKHGRQVSFIQI